MSNNFVDYDYDLYGYTDYRGGYNDSYYDDYFRSYDGEQFFDYTANSGTGPQNTNQRNNRNISVGEQYTNTHNKISHSKTHKTKTQIELSKRHLVEMKREYTRKKMI